MSKRTTVAEMIAALQKLPPDACLVTPGYEGGFHDAILPVGPAKLAFDRTVPNYYGPHDVAGNTVKGAGSEGPPAYLIGEHAEVGRWDWGILDDNA